MQHRKQPLNVREVLITDTVVGLAAFLVSNRITSAPLLPNIVAAQIYAHFIGTLAHASLFWAYPRIADWKSIPKWSAIFLILAVDATIGCAAGATLMGLLGFYSSDRFWAQFQDAYRVSLTVTFIFGVTGSITETLKSKLEWATRQRERAIQLATEARLSSLESRIHPHFMFNALNSISSLVREDPDRAERLLERMAALLRFSLDMKQLGFVTLAQEMEIVRAYLEIEKARFGARLQFSIDMPAEAGSVHVPPLSIQTLVENSVKFAIAPRREGGSITVSACQANGNLEIEVRDEGPGVDLRSAPPGHGLDLLQSRLDMLYEGAAMLRSEGSCVTISVPCSAPTLSTTKS